MSVPVSRALLLPPVVPLAVVALVASPFPIPGLGAAEASGRLAAISRRRGMY